MFNPPPAHGNTDSPSRHRASFSKKARGRKADSHRCRPPPSDGHPGFDGPKVSYPIAKDRLPSPRGDEARNVARRYLAPGLHLADKLHHRRRHTKGRDLMRHPQEGSRSVGVVHDEELLDREQHSNFSAWRKISLWGSPLRRPQRATVT